MSNNLLFLSPNLGSGGGGAERQIVTVACLLKEQGYNVEFLCYDPGNFYASILEDKGIKIHWRILPNYVKRTIEVRRFIRRGRYDAVISFLQTPNFLNCFAAIGGRNWKIITGERSAKEDDFISSKIKIFCWFQRFSDKIVCNSENAKKMWLKHYPQYAEKLEVIYNNVTLQSITSEYVPKKNGKLHIVVAASYQYLKNPIGLIKALALMSERERELVHIDWYGRNDGKPKEVFDEAQSLIEANGLKNIALHPTCADMHNTMNRYDAVALFSKFEGLPNAICEGMMLGKPIIMTRISDYKVLVDETNGFLCDWDKPESIKEALLAAAALRTEELQKMGDISKERAERLFSRDAISSNWINLL